MKRTFLLLAVTTLGLTLSSCSSVVPSGTVSAAPVGGGPLYKVNNVALHHYDPALYTPFAYDHRGTNHEMHYRNQALREAARNGRSGTVTVGRVIEGQ